MNLRQTVLKSVMFLSLAAFVVLLIRSSIRSSTNTTTEEETVPVAVTTTTAVGTAVPDAKQTTTDTSSSLVIHHHLGNIDLDVLYLEFLRSFPIEERGNHTVVEVGCADGSQAAFAVSHGYRFIAMEPSPRNHLRTLSKVILACNRMKKSQTPPPCAPYKVHAYAATAVESVLKMRVGGTAGDHIATEGKIAVGEEANFRGLNTVDVKGKPIDIVLHDLKNVHVLKIDVQDHEPSALDGAQNILSQHIVDFVLIEFRPQGWRHMFPQRKPDDVIHNAFIKNGYTLYYCGFQCRNRYKKTPNGWGQQSYALDEFVKVVEGFHNPVDERFGCWTDLIAVAPRMMDRPEWKAILKFSESKQVSSNP
eukprot:PhF_6_TR14235/c0_g1_i4/m.22830